MNIYEKCSHVLHDVAHMSPIKYPIAAVLLAKKKMITRPRNNSDRSSFHGAFHSSLHAEMNALLDYYGQRLQWDRMKHTWSLSSQGKDRYIGYSRYSQLSGEWHYNGTTMSYVPSYDESRSTPILLL